MFLAIKYYFFLSSISWFWHVSVANDYLTLPRDSKSIKVAATASHLRLVIYCSNALNSKKDQMLQKLDQGECNTDNLSPWPGVAKEGEKLNHDEFMRRLLVLNSIDENRKHFIDERGRSYLEKIRQMDSITRATSIASYENGGLESVFRAILRSQHWDNALLQAFRHFLVEHIKFDSDTEKGHGALSRQLTVNDQILPLWTEFCQLLVQSVPSLSDSE